jgi:hypothetical protein
MIHPKHGLGDSTLDILPDRGQFKGRINRLAR